MIGKSLLILAHASRGNPVIATLTVMAFSFLFNILEAGIETLIFGERFVHWLDPVFMAAFIVYAGCAVWACAICNIKEKRERNNDMDTQA